MAFPLFEEAAARTLWRAPAGAQEIKRVAEPNQSVRMPHGSYVCDGQINTSPVDETYAMVTCTGPMYNASDYAALYTKLNHDELVKMNANTQRAISRDMKAAIHKQIQALPPNLRQSAAIQNLEKSLTDYVDQRLPEGRDAGSARAGRPGDATASTGAAAAQGQE